MIFDGLKKISNSAKGMMCIIILISSFIGLLLNKLDGASFAAVIGTLAIIYNFTHMKTDISNGNMPDKGKL